MSDSTDTSDAAVKLIDIANDIMARNINAAPSVPAWACEIRARIGAVAAALFAARPHLVTDRGDAVALIDAYRLEEMQRCGRDGDPVIAILYPPFLTGEGRIPIFAAPTSRTDRSERVEAAALSLWIEAGGNPDRPLPPVGSFWGDKYRAFARVALSASDALAPAATDGDGYVFLNPDAGTEWSKSHPVESGEAPDAQNIRRSTLFEDQLVNETLGADAAQDFAQAYYLVKGESPPWSKTFGAQDALDEIKDAIDAMKAIARDALAPAAGQPVGWITQDALKDILNDEPWAAGAFTQLSQRKKDEFTVPLYTAAGQPMEINAVVDAAQALVDYVRDPYSSDFVDEEFLKPLVDALAHLPRDRKGEDRLRHLADSAEAFLHYFNPFDMAEDKSQQWQSLMHEIDLARAALRKEPSAPGEE